MRFILPLDVMRSSNGSARPIGSKGSYAPSSSQRWLRAQQLDPDRRTQEDFDVIRRTLTRKATPNDFFVTNAASELIFLYRMGRVNFR